MQARRFCRSNTKSNFHSPTVTQKLKYSSALVRAFVSLRYPSRIERQFSPSQNRLRNNLQQNIFHFQRKNFSSVVGKMSSSNCVAVACIQLLSGKDKTANVENAKNQIDEAMDRDASTKLIVLPECWNSPYGTQFFREYGDRIPDVGAKAGDGCSESVAMMLDAAQRHGVHIVGGSIPEIADGEKVYNTCVVCGPDGTILAKHRKVHLFDIDIPNKIRFIESEVLSAGDQVTVFETPFGKVGVGICYDIRFAELAAAMRAQDAKLLVYPGAFNMTTGPLHWELLQRARAVDNQCFVVTTAPARVEDGGYCSWGHSTIVDPWGKILASCEAEETTIRANLDLNSLDEVRASIPVSRQRRPEVYK